MRKYLFVLFAVFFVTVFSANAVAEEIQSGVQEKEDPFKFTFKNGVNLKFYGAVEMLTYYDTTSPAISDWLAFVYRDGTIDGDEDSFNMAVRASKFGFHFNYPELIKNAQVNARLEADFVGGYSTGTTVPYSPLVRLKQAWVSVDWEHISILGGQTFGIFGPLFPDVGSWIALGTSGNPWIRLPQVRLTVNYSPIKWEVSANRPMAANVSDGGSQDDIISDGEYSNMPFWMTRLGFDRGFGLVNLSTGISGVYGMEKIIREADDDNNTATPDIVTVNEMLNVYMLVYDLKVASKYIDFMGEFFWGKNLNTFYAGVLQGINSNEAIGSATGTAWGINTMGGWAQVTLKPTQKLYFNLGGGVDNPENEDLNNAQRSSNIMAYANVNYRITPNWKVGLEPSYMKTGYIGGDSNYNIRGMLNTVFSF